VEFDDPFEQRKKVDRRGMGSPNSWAQQRAAVTQVTGDTLKVFPL
jgi:hypothetical protein